MKLYLVQHGEAVSKDIDPGRPLSPDGVMAVQSIVTHMYNRHIELNSVYHSGKMRAHQTAEIFADTLFVGGEITAIDEIKPNDDVEVFAKKIPELKPDTMIIGHLPFMAKLLSFLVTGKEEPHIVSYKPGSVVCLAQNEEKPWHISWMLRPDCI